MKIRTFPFIISMVFITMICLSRMAVGADYIFQQIAINEASESVAYGINENTIVGKFLDENGWHGFTYDISSGDVTVLDHTDPGGVFQTVATGINGSNRVVGYFRGTSGQFGFSYDGSAYSTFAKADTLMTMASDINNDTGTGGEVVTGSFLSSLTYEGFGLIFDVSDPVADTEFKEGFFTAGLGINDAGEIVGSIWRQHPPAEPFPTYDQYGFFRAPDTGEITAIKYKTIADCFYTDAYDINNEGLILGNFSCYTATPSHGGFLIHKDDLPSPSVTMFDVIQLSGIPEAPDPVPIYWRFYGINNERIIVGGYMDFFGWHAFMAEPVAP